MSRIVKLPKKRRRKGRWTTARDYGAAKTPRFGQSGRKASGLLRRILPLLLLVAAIIAWTIWQGARDPDTLPQPPGAPPPQEETALSRSSPSAGLEAQQPGAGGFAGASPADIYSANFTRCGSGKRVNCVVDGDTIWFGGEKIRFAAIDTPEISSPGCAREAELGEAATVRMQELLNEGPFALTLNPGDENRDRYGRLLRRVSRDGQDLGEVLIAEGLSDRWPSSIDWCG